jgi:hypothetical protein
MSGLIFAKNDYIVGYVLTASQELFDGVLEDLRGGIYAEQKSFVPSEAEV